MLIVAIAADADARQESGLCLDVNLSTLHALNPTTESVHLS